MNDRGMNNFQSHILLPEYFMVRNVTTETSGCQQGSRAELCFCIFAWGLNITSNMPASSLVRSLVAGQYEHIAGQFVYITRNFAAF